jgi:GNAT superfamily N-acetyltransferase
MRALEFRDEAPTAAAFKALYDNTGWGHGERPEADFAQALVGSWACCSVFEAGRLVGIGRVISDGRLHAYVNEMIVAPSHQGRGIGREILRRLLGRCHAAGITDIQLFASSGKAGFYAAQGFVPRPDDRPGMQFQPVSP